MGIRGISINSRLILESISCKMEIVHKFCPATEKLPEKGGTQEVIINKSD